MVDLNPNTIFEFEAHEGGAILSVLITSESTGYHELVDIGMSHSRLLELYVVLQSDPVDWKNDSGILNVKGEGNKLTLIVNLEKVDPNRTNSYEKGKGKRNPIPDIEDAVNETIIRHLDEEESKLFREEVSSYAFQENP